jgi:hypothetical protein
MDSRFRGNDGVRIFYAGEIVFAGMTTLKVF